MLKHKLILYCLIGLSAPGTSLQAQQTLEIGVGKPYATLEQAAQAAQPGDTLLLSPGVHSGGMYIENLQGLPQSWIVIRGKPGAGTTILGGTNAIQFTDPAYLIIEELTFREQTGNGVNIDDGGSYATPAHDILIRHCVFEDMNASGNNDLLKLSGLDSFNIQSCTFRNGAAGGSGIDMVGCHKGRIHSNLFQNLGSNSIQAKGGTRYITMIQNTFLDGGQRSLNLGGSTGAPYFRPLGADYEAADLNVVANIFIGSEAPIAYVGSQHVRVWNNTIYRPDKWVMRILQESSDTSFYKAVADGEFVNNLVIVDNGLAIATNIGPNTNAASFLVARNLWYHLDQPNWTGPYLPSPEIEGLVQIDPEVVDLAMQNFYLTSMSPAIQAGWTIPDPTWTDHDYQPYLDPPSIGAIEGGINTSFQDWQLPQRALFYPNPAVDQLYRDPETNISAVLFDLSGQEVMALPSSENSWDISQLANGIYFISAQNQSVQHSESLLIFRK
ncbi:MAG: right-handed parallel beta-helix repeat-containing protein [Saprospiraceae bacterium]|nr:right-handed parallel beta-helix repeat-containing protein [Saprospiraceae bacterium]